MRLGVLVLVREWPLLLQDRVGVTLEQALSE